MPKDQQELEGWIEKLKAAGKTYRIINGFGKVGLEVDAADAVQILGIAEPKKMKTWVKVVIWVVAGLVALAIFAPPSEEDKAKTAPSVAVDPVADSIAQRAAMIKKGFSAWDGSHIELTALIKNAMNDPRSYEHAETRYWDMQDHLVVKTTFRGANGFGGVVLTHVTAKCTLDGHVIEVTEQY